MFGGLSHAAAVTISVTFAFLLVTSIHITFGELTPKLLAIPRAETTARRLSRPLGAFRVISAPFALGLTKVANSIVGLFGAPASLDEQASSEDLKIIICPVTDRWIA